MNTPEAAAPFMRALFVSALLVLTTALSVCAQEAPAPAAATWWDPAWSCRRIVTLPPADGPTRVFSIELPTLGRVKPDGSDVRVLVGATPVSHTVLSVGPDDRMKLAFEAPAGAETAYVYFDNPKSPSPAAWEPPAGLLLETRADAGPAVDNLDQFRAAFRKAARPQRRDFVPRVEFGHNPFGPSQDFLSRFTGFLICPVAGTYEFATTSDDASFLLVEGREVCSWPGEHAAVRDARHTGRVELTAGVHRFEYNHQQRAGDCAMVAAWKPPGKPMAVIPADAFVPVLQAKPGPLELKVGGWTPDFLARSVGEAVLTPEDDRHLVRIRFENLTTPQKLAGAKLTWSFGDGATSSEPAPEHVYLVEGTYTVTLKLSIGADERTLAARVDARRSFARQASPLDDRADYADIVAGYDVKTLNTEPLYWAMYYFDRVTRPADVIAAGRALVSRTGVTDEKLLFDAVMLLGETERVRGTDYRAVQTLYQDFEAKLKDPAQRAALALAQGDVQQWHLKDLVHAEGCYRHILADYRDTARPETTRKALYRLGEIYRWRGDGPKTREFFERAQKIPCTDLTEPQQKVRQGYLARAIEDYVRTDQMGDAYTLLTQWAWEYPTDMLQGYWSSLRIRWLLKNKEYEGGIAEAETLLRVNPRSTYAVEVLMLAADCAESLKAPDRARKLLQRALAEYPESPDRAAVQKRLDALK